MRTVEDHAREVRELLAPVLAMLREGAPERLAIDDPGLAGRVVAEELRSPIPLPPFDNSQMDGYAVRSAEVAAALAGSAGGAGGSVGAGEPGAAADTGVAEFRIGRTVAAGDPPVAHEPGTASPVMTGAPLPTGADTVIPIERADPPRFTELRRARDEAPAGTVRFTAAPAAGEFVRPLGSDLPEGEPLLPAGARLTPARIGLLANAGIAEVPVRPRLRILLVTTGDEVAAPGEEIAPGRVFDANTPLLAAALRGAGALVTPARAADRPEELARLVLELAEEHDLLVTSGGISAGAFEVVREALAPLGVRFLGVAMQPGGPQGLGIAGFGEHQLPALCFPGNPVSSALSAEVFLLPLLREHAGRAPRRAPERRPLAHAVDSPEGKHQLRRGRIDAEGRVHVTPPSSHLLADLAAAEILAHLPVGVAHLDAGDPVEIWRLDD